MYLRANGVSLYFPADPATVANVGLRRGDHLGGTPVMFRGKPSIRALDDVSVDLEAGARLGIVGHNGSGKSTLLRVLAGLYPPQQGTVQASGQISGIFNMSVGFRQEATGYRNIFLKGLMAGRSRSQIAAAIPEIADFTGLGSYLAMPLHAYSQGMALRLAFAITTTFSHDILVMDEWIGAGDASFQEKVIARMNSVIESSSISVIASHNNQLLRRITNQCVWLEDGAIRQVGATGEVLDAYDAQVRADQNAAIRQQQNASPRARLPIPAGHCVLWQVPDDHNAAAGTPPVLAWDVADFNIGHTSLTVAKSQDAEEQVMCTGGSKGSRKAGQWVRPGMIFRLRDQADRTLLAEIVAQ